MRKTFQTLTFAAFAPLALAVTASQATAAGPMAAAKLAGPADTAVTRVGGYGYGYRDDCCVRRYYRPRYTYYRRPAARYYYAAPSYYAPRAYYAPPSYYAAPVVVYPPPVVYYSAPAAYPAYAAPAARYYTAPARYDYDWDYTGW
jgi:hypothetical protein